MPSTRHVLPGLVAALSACAGSATARLAPAEVPAVAVTRKAEPRPAPVSAEAGRALVESLCGDCHGGSAKDGRPDFTLATLEPKLAAKALRAVLAREMPPPNTIELGDEDRRGLVAYLCADAERGETYCASAVARDRNASPIRSGQTFLQSVKRVSDRPVPSALADAVLIYSRPRSTQTVLTPGTVAASLAVAAAICAPGAGQRACFARVVELGSLAAEPPHDAAPKAAP